MTIFEIMTKPAQTDDLVRALKKIGKPVVSQFRNDLIVLELPGVRKSTVSKHLAVHCPLADCKINQRVINLRVTR